MCHSVNVGLPHGGSASGDLPPLGLCFYADPPPSKGKSPNSKGRPPSSKGIPPPPPRYGHARLNAPHLVPCCVLQYSYVSRSECDLDQVASLYSLGSPFTGTNFACCVFALFVNSFDSAPQFRESRVVLIRVFSKCQY